MNYPTKKIIVLDEYFPEELVHGLIGILENNNTRRIEYDFRRREQVIPKSVQSVVHYATKKNVMKFNYVVLKTYDTRDKYVSGAHSLHVDPPTSIRDFFFFVLLAGTQSW